jgi:hypothetical protein
MARSISVASPTGDRVNVTESEGAAASIDCQYWPEWVFGLKMAAVRATWGATSLRSSSHFPPIEGSKLVKPVALPPGRARLSTNPAPTGSGTLVNTIGTKRVACNNGPRGKACRGQNDVLG